MLLHEIPPLARTSLPCQERPLNCNTLQGSCWQGLRKRISTETAGTSFKATVSARFMFSACPSYRQISFRLCWSEWLAVVQQHGFVSSSLVKMFYHHLGCQVASVLSFFPFVQSEFTVKVKHRSKAPQVSFLAFWKGELILSASPWSCAEVHLPTYMHTAHEWILRGTTARRCLPLTTAGLCPPSSMC